MLNSLDLNSLTISGEGLIRFDNKFSFPFIREMLDFTVPFEHSIPKNVFYATNFFVLVDGANVIYWKEDKIRVDNVVGGFVSGDIVVIFTENRAYVFSDTSYKVIDLIYNKPFSIQVSKTFNSFTFLAVVHIENNSILTLENSSVVASVLVNNASGSVSIDELFQFLTTSTFPYSLCKSLYVYENDILLSFENVSYQLSVNASDFVYLKVVKSYPVSIKFNEVVEGASYILGFATLLAMYDSGVFVFEDRINDCFIYTSDFKTLFYGRSNILISPQCFINFMLGKAYKFSLVPDNLRFDIILPPLFAMFKASLPRPVRLNSFNLDIQSLADFTNNYFLVDSTFNGKARSFKYKITRPKNLYLLNLVGDTFVMVLSFYGGYFTGELNIE